MEEKIKEGQEEVNVEQLRGIITDPEEVNKTCREAQEQAGTILGMAFLFCGLKTHMESEMIIHGETFNLSFTKK
jgi:hypothetical protein